MVTQQADVRSSKHYARVSSIVRAWFRSLRQCPEYELVDRREKYVYPIEISMILISNDLSIAIQGIGGGPIINMSEIIVSDLVPLAERGLYQGLVGLTWAFACGVGPPIVSVLHV